MVNRATVALVGSDSLLGREIRDIVSTSAPELELRLIAAGAEEPGRLTRVGDEPAMVERLEAGNLTGARAVVLAGAAETSREALDLIEPGTTVIDLTYAAEERPDARLRAPLVESEIDDAEAAVQVIAHPAAIALALLLRRLHAQDPIRR